jgi:heme oxygenase
MRWLHASCRNSVAATSPAAGLADPTDALLAAVDSDLQGREPRRGEWPSPQPPESEAGHWGVAYVIEGSSLGAPHVLAAARRALPAGTPCAYLTTLAAGADARWPRFAAALGALELDAEPALEAARATFERARSLFLEDAADVEAG